MDKKHLLVVIVIFAIANIYSLYKYNSIGNDYSRLQQESFIDKYRSNSYTISSKLIDKSNIISTFVEDSLNNFKYKYLVFSTNLDCSNCITDTIEKLSKIDSKLEEKLLFVYQEFEGEGFKYSDFFEFYNFDYASKEVDHVSYFKKFEIAQFPVFIIYDKESKETLEAFQPEPNNTILLNAFANKAKILKEK